MKVLYLINQYPKISHTFIRREIEALEKQGVEVVRVTSTNNPDELVDQDDINELPKTRLLVKGQAVALVKALLTTALKHPIYFSKALKQTLSMARKANFRIIHHAAYLAEACLLLKMCQEENIEHIHAHFGTNPAAIAMLTRLLGGPSYSFTVHGPEDFDHPAELSMSDKIHHAAFVVAITSFCKSQLFRWCEFPHWKKIEIVHCGVDEKMLEHPHPQLHLCDSSQHDNTFKFINIGRLSEQKGQMLLLEAMNIVHKKGIKAELHVIGDGPFRPQLEAYIKQQGLGDVVKLVGAKSGTEVRDALDQADVMVLPSFAEGLPVVIMEALARKKPVLSTLIAGIPELINHQCGWLVPAGDENSLASKMILSTTIDLDALKQMGEMGYIAVSQRHNIDTEAAKLKGYFELYAECER